MRIYIILYIVMKSTLRNSVKEVYKKSNSNNNNNYGFNNSLVNNNNQNTSNNISINNKNLNTNKKNALNQNTNSNSYNEIKTKPIFNMNNILIMIFFVILISIIGLIVYFKDKVLEFIKNTFFKEETEKAQNEINSLKSELEENQKIQLMIEE